jgi:hypothetical protein
VKTTFKTEGFAELEAGLGEFKKATARNVLKRAGLDAMQPVADEMERRAPRDQQDLAEAIDTGTRLPRGGKRHFRDRGTVEIYAGVKVVGGGMPPQATQQEFGNEHHGPQPYARPGWDAERGQVIPRLAESLGREIDAAKARARKRAKR